MAYCDRCDRYFPHDRALQQHEENSNAHHVCWSCGIDFSTFRGLEEHYIQSQRHAYCRECQSHFDDTAELWGHCDSQHYWCRDCDKFFVNDRGLHEHNRQTADHWYCAQCKRRFIAESNLRSHLNSSTHVPKTVPCPGRDCGQTFVSRAAMVLHLESGTCSSGTTRAIIDRYVREHDRNNVITDPSRMLTNGDASSTTLIATDRSWNAYRQGYECYLCHRVFGVLSDLNKHLASPKHQDRIYRCPLHTCGQNFATLSGLCQHIESERCGVSKFAVVKDTMNQVLGQMRRIGM